MSKPLKIAIYSGEIPSTTFIERLILGLSAQGHQLYVFGLLHKKPVYPFLVKVAGYKPQMFYKAYHLVKYSVLLFLFKYKAKRTLDSLLRATHQDTMNYKVKYYPVLWYRPDVFHVQWAKSIEDWLWVQAFGMKLVLSLRGAHINYSPIADPALAALYRRCFPKVDRFHAVSKAIGKEAELYGAEVSKIHVVYSGLDSKPLGLSTTSETVNLNIISVGRPHWVKGYPYALDTCKLLKEKNIPFRYTIIGAAPDLELVYHVKDLDLSNEVSLTQPLTFNEVQKLVRQADVLVLPSVKEGIANVVLEAMALGTLVLSTDCGGMDEVIADGENGYLVPVRDPKALAERLVHISSLTQDQKAVLLSNAQATIEQQHTSLKMIHDMEALYQKVMSK